MLLSIDNKSTVLLLKTLFNFKGPKLSIVDVLCSKTYPLLNTLKIPIFNVVGTFESGVKLFINEK